MGIPSLGEEYAGADLGDLRLSKRLLGIAERMAEQPDRSFPKAMHGEAELEAVYRFFQNEKVTWRSVLAPHVARTVSRVANCAEPIVVAHDTTEFGFGGEARIDLGRLLQQGRGFYGHFALAVGGREIRDPLGVLALKVIVRDEERVTESAVARHRNPDKEQRRWLELAEEVEAALEGCIKPIHVMDREADSYEIFDGMMSAGRRFVIRLTHNRVLQGGESKLFDELKQVEGIAEREVPLGHRKRSAAPSHRKIHPPRAARSAKLAFAATTVCLPRPPHLESSLAKKLQLNVVRVFEVDTPAGCEPVEWRLVTTEPIDTTEQVLAIVDFYRKRWVIEEIFKSLKTGCSVEKRQLESLDGLLKMIALFVPIAWSLLRLRVLARESADTPADIVLTQAQIAILQSTPRSKARIGSRHPSVRDALLAIAALGGHLPRNGEPGWITLHRGYEELLTLERGWLLARSAEK
jgi:hypothetical protein